MESLYAYFKDEKLTVQPNKYQDEGWYMVNEGCFWTLYEVNTAPNGSDQRIFTSSSFGETYEKVSTLT